MICDCFLIVQVCDISGQTGDLLVTLSLYFPTTATLFYCTDNFVRRRLTYATTYSQQGLEFDSTRICPAFGCTSGINKVGSGCVKALMFLQNNSYSLTNAPILPGHEVTPSIRQFDRYLLTVQCPVRCVHLPQSGIEGVTTV